MLQRKSATRRPWTASPVCFQWQEIETAVQDYAALWQEVSADRSVYLKGHIGVDREVNRSAYADKDRR